MASVKKVFVTKLNGKSSFLLGFADVSLCLGNEDTWDLTLKGFRILSGKNGMFVALPSQKDPNGKKDENGRDKYWDTVVINKESEAGIALMEEITERVLGEFNAQGNPNNREKNVAKKTAARPSNTAKPNRAQGNPDEIDDESVPF